MTEGKQSAGRRRVGGRIAVVALALGAAAAVASLALAGGPPSPDNEAGPALGLVPVHTNAGKVGGGSNLVYHNGPILKTNVTYTIYWKPSVDPNAAGHTFSAGYQPLIDRFFGDVQHDNGLTTNTYFSTTQYYDTTQSTVGASSTFAGAIVDTNPFPASGCADSVAQTDVCLSAAQLSNEISTVITANGLPRGGNAIYFLFTPKGVGSCSGSSCAFSHYCAFHSWTGSGTSQFLWANQPYTMTVPSACSSSQFPNADDADPTINVVSHEHQEAMTDPNGNAWYDRTGYENADKCAWKFGTALGGTGGALYNQLINSNRYYLQQDWSNKSSGCVLTGQ